MATLHLLGTGASLSGPGRTTTMLAFAVKGSSILVDCGGDAIERYLSAELDLNWIDLLILTHQHPDHVGAFPLLVQKLWLAKRQRPLPIRGPRSALDQARRLFETFDTARWEQLPPLQWQDVEMVEGAEVWRNDHWQVTASPGQHGRTPSIAIRVSSTAGEGSVIYSADTEYADSIVQLARGGDILVHEATGGFPGHSSAEDAARAAAEAGVKKLVLVHLPPGAESLDLTEARRIFPALELGTDGAKIDF